MSSAARSGEGVRVTEPMTPSFVVTLQIDDANFAWLNALRRDHFPPERNLLDAHLTLFHKLDGDGIAAIERVLAGDRRGEIALSFSHLMPLGRGVAIAVTSPSLLDLRARLTRVLGAQLTAQDRQPFRPHVTIQNKVEPIAARALLTQLGSPFTPRQGLGRAVQFWEYLGGPWRLRSSTTLAAHVG